MPLWRYELRLLTIVPAVELVKAGAAGAEATCRMLRAYLN